MIAPETLEDWCAAYIDDIGYEAVRDCRATTAPPGSLAKIEALRQRLAAGQRLWSPYDAGAVDAAPEPSWTVIGSPSYGVVVGEDAQGHPHRFAAWSALPQRPGQMSRLAIYAPAYASYVDRFDGCPELYAIARHARLIGATCVAVCPMFTARIKTERDLRTIETPCDMRGLYWLRVLAKQAWRKIVCYGETPTMRRHKDVYRVLALGRSTPHAVATGIWPPMITRVTPGETVPYEMAADFEPPAPETDRYVLDD